MAYAAPTIATTDTNGDHQVTSSDRVSIFFSGANGKNLIEIVPPADRILSVDQVVKNEVFIVYQRGSTLMAGVFDTRTGATIKESPISIDKSE